MNSPLFSILVPTKDRPDLIAKTVEYYLFFEYRNFEIVVIDNNLNQDTQTALASYNDTRLRIVKTGGLSMVANWEESFNHAWGVYSIIIGDKILLKESLLHALAKDIELHERAVYSFNHYPLGEQYRPETFYTFKSQTVIKDFLNGKFSWFRAFAPLGYRCCVKTEIIENIKSKHSRLIYGISPDFAIAYMLLLTQSEFTLYNDSSFTVVANAPSNGISSQSGGELVKVFLKELNKTEDDFTTHLSIKVPSTHISTINDFIEVSQVTGAGYSEKDFNPVKLCVIALKDMLYAKLNFDVNQTSNTALLKEYMRQQGISPLHREFITLRWSYRKAYIRYVARKYLKPLIALRDLLKPSQKK